ncbi:MAG: NUDIX hydrolase [Longimicrobiales bacterium]
MTSTERPEKPGLIRRRTIHEGRIVNLSVDQVRFPDGSTGELEMIRHSGAAAALPVLGSDDEPDPPIVLVRQYRYAAGGELLEVPAGRPDRHDEPWETCAAREVEEETGLRPGRLVHLTTIYTTPGFTDERILLFLALDCVDGDVAPDDDEFLQPVRMRLSEAIAAVGSGRITDAKTICLLLYVEQFARDLLR